MWRILEDIPLMLLLLLLLLSWAYGTILETLTQDHHRDALEGMNCWCTNVGHMMQLVYWCISSKPY